MVFSWFWGVGLVWGVLIDLSEVGGWGRVRLEGGVE